jgi:toxin FitB
MKWLVDTDVASQTAKLAPNRQVTAWLRKHAADCFVSELTVAEIAYGVAVAPEDRQAPLATWLATFRAEYRDGVLPVTEAVLVAWKELIVQCKASGRTIACEDSLLAAHAQSLGYGVATLNRTHFAAAGCCCADFTP